MISRIKEKITIMNSSEMIIRIRKFGIRIIVMADQLSKSYSAQVISHQVLRSGTSAGANYSAACRSKSKKDFINKLKIVEEELDETKYWLDLIVEAKLFPEEKISGLKTECNELISIIVKSLITAKANLKVELKQ
jgi:four helix bundle protein